MKLSIIVALLPAVFAAPAAKRAEAAPVVTPGNSKLIPNKYIVKFKDQMSIEALDETVKALSEKADHVYSSALRGFAGILSAKDLEELRHHSQASCYWQAAVHSRRWAKADRSTA
ncbi:hypothetical protein CDD81_1679 [Ophiocordyceps australis]|uniref:Inhibitor I9 domain-containing protein n=1 Tax=Ophiocordyceps australis TaxID=1399860 RepID=A0A2C5Y0K0_9HYPO|nr:hypothetical protein CDD81_1679 [Ophiocordyceps australis]